MKFDNAVTQTTSGVFTPIAMSFIMDSIAIMIPWLIVMFAVIVTDLIAGVRKSIKIGVDVSPSTAFRETMGKMVTYFAWVIMVCLVEAAVGRGEGIAKWACLLVIAVEGGSIVSNLLKPYGIDISTRSVLKFFFMRSPLHPSEEEAEELIKEDRIEQLRQREHEKWNHKSKK